jgi:hypothetical protein
MLIHITDHTRVNDLCDHYRRSSFQAEPVGGTMVRVDLDDATTPEQARREAELHLRIWELLNPDVPGILT